MNIGFYVWIEAPRHRIWVREEYDGAPVETTEVTIEVMPVLSPVRHHRMTIEQTEELIAALREAVKRATSLQG